MEVAARQNLWSVKTNLFDYCFISRAHCGITTDISIQHTATVGMEAVLLWFPETICNGNVIFGHTGGNSSSSDTYDFRLFIYNTNKILIMDRANGRTGLGSDSYENWSNVWHKVTFEGRNPVYIDNNQMPAEHTPSIDSNSCFANFFSPPYQDDSQNNVAVRYVRLYNTSTHQDIANFVPCADGMMDLVSRKTFTPSSSSAQFEVVEWKSLSEVEGWKDLNEGLALILLAQNEIAWKEAA